MLTQARYESEAATARAKRAAAKTDEEAVQHDEVATAYATAARHAGQHFRWVERAASERNAARLGPLRLGGGRGPVDPVAERRGLAQAARSALIAQNHRQAAEQYADAGAEARPPDAGADVGPPTCVDVPQVQGTGTVGSTLTCTMGNWTGMQAEPHSYAYQWLRDGAAPIGAGGTTYVVVSADVGHSLTCRVTATNPLGSAQSPPSNAVAVSAGGDDC
jgi:hypothetical protein